LLVIPAKAGIQLLLLLLKRQSQSKGWIPAFAGMTSKSGKLALIFDFRLPGF
jgi:hypothetical protein